MSGAVPLAKNGIWYAEKQNGEWMPPRNLPLLNTDLLEQSYPSIAADGQMIYVSESHIGGKSSYDLYQTTFMGEKTRAGSKLELVGTPYQCGDPWISPDGSYLIFTRYDPDRWVETCDLMIAFKEGEGWSNATPLKELNSSGSDFSPMVTADGADIYYRKNYVMTKAPFQVLLQQYQIKN